jgi:hypothetical protein
MEKMELIKGEKNRALKRGKETFSTSIWKKLIRAEQGKQKKVECNYKVFLGFSICLLMNGEKEMVEWREK